MIEYMPDTINYIYHNFNRILKLNCFSNQVIQKYNQSHFIKKTLE